VQALHDSRLLDQIVTRPDVMLHWSRDVQVLSDDPLKARLAGDVLARSSVANALSMALNESQQTVTLVSAYFVPGERGTQTLTRLARSGRRLTILTNSLAATDVIAVHGGYAPYRSRLIDAGAAVWELKPDSLPTQRKPSAFGSTVASLHTKAAIIDQQLFVGSFNLDPRSVSLNCEQGVLVRDAALAAQAAALFARVAAPEHAWRVSRDGAGQLQWKDGQRTLDSEPGASLARRVLARVTNWLPLESQL
jgi:putative cardiolipin synthase